MGKIVMKLIGILALGVSLKVWIDTNVFKVQGVQFETEKLPRQESLRIVQITDVHNKKSLRIHERVIGKVRELAPDMIVLTGDLVDRKTRNFSAVFSFIDGLAQTDVPLFFVTGNHEWTNPKRAKLLTGLRKRGVTIFSNESFEIKRNKSVINLVGIEDSATKHEDLYEAFSGLKEEYYTILLSHSPYVIKRYPFLPADLVVSGHTHGGQVRFPFIGAAISPGGGIFPELDKGVFEWGENRQVYIDSGLGTSMAPIRFMNQSQISLIYIKGTGPI